MQSLRQKPSPVKKRPAEDPMTPEQWNVLAAIADTVVADISPSAAADSLTQLSVSHQEYNAAIQRIETAAQLGPDTTLVNTYLAEKATSDPRFKEAIFRMFSLYVHNNVRWTLTFLLSALGSSAGAYLLTGYATPFDKLPLKTRQEILLGWAKSRIGIQRRLARSLPLIAAAFWIRTSSTMNRLLAYPQTPVHDIPPHTTFPFEFIQIPESTLSEPETIETDVVIVGSGCGGAVAAKTLAESGLRVLVVEKSFYWTPEHLPMSELEGFEQLFGNGGQHQSEDSSIAVINGSAWGGGGTINWSASLQTQGFVRREWSDKFGLHHFLGSGFQADLDAVCDRMGAGIDQIPHNKGNRSLLDGAKKLGWAAKAVPQNTGGEAHNCGYCTLGCGSSGKKGPTESFLPDAARAGARFIEGFEVKEVLFSSATKGEREAIGVKGLWTSRDNEGLVSGDGIRTREVIVRARRVVLAAGPLETPLMLKRAGFTLPHIGRHLHLHPVSIVGAVWDEEIRPWEGPILSTVVNEFENLDGVGYGPKLECVTMLPGIFLPFFKWEGALKWKEYVPRMKYMTGYISLARDRYGGSVVADPNDGGPVIRYTPHPHDKKHILEGVIRICEILYVEGAREIILSIPGIDPYIRPTASPAVVPHASTLTASPATTQTPSINDPDFAAWIAKIRNNGFPTEGSGFASAHQMGTCRMGTSPKNSVTDARARVWGTQNLYIADTSVFPNASGVNPMATVMAIARGTARGIVAEEVAKGNVLAAAAKAKI